MKDRIFFENKFVRTLDLVEFERSYIMKASPVRRHLENCIATPSRSSGGKRLSIWLEAKSKSTQIRTATVCAMTRQSHNNTSVIRGPAIMKAGG